MKPAQDTSPRYPRLASLIAELSKQLPRRGLTPRMEALGIARSTYYTYRDGKSCPPDHESAAKLAALLLPIDAPEATRIEITTEIERIREEAGVTLSLPQLRLSRRLKVSHLDYLPFAGPRGETEPFQSKQDKMDAPTVGFLDEVIERLLSLSGLAADSNVPSRPRTGFDVVRALREGDVQAATGLFDTIDRTLDGLRTYHSPIRISVNFLLVEHPEDSLNPEQMDHLRSLLTADGTSKQEILKLVRPIALPAEVGFSYLVDSLGIDESSVTKASDLNPKTLVDLIEETHKKTATPRRLLLCCDEMTILRVLTLCVTQRKLSWRPRIAFPIATAKSAANSRINLPMYPVGLITFGPGVQQPVLDYFRSAFSLTLLGDVEYFSGWYLNLYTKTVETIRSNVAEIEKAGDKTWDDFRDVHAEETLVPGAPFAPALASRFARYTLRLSEREDVDDLAEYNLPWHRILDRSRQKIGPVETHAEYPEDIQFRLEYRPLIGLTQSRPGSEDHLQDSRPEPQYEPSTLQELGWLGQLLMPFQELVYQPFQRFSPRASPAFPPDVRIGFAASLTRSHEWKHYAVPVRYPMNCVVFYQKGGSPDNVKAWLEASPGDPLRNVIQAYVSEQGLAENYLRSSRLVAPELIRQFRYSNPSDLFTLTKNDNSEKRVKAAFLDLEGCLQMIEANPKTDLRLVWSEDPMGAGLPAYHSGFSVRRTSTKWIAFFDEAFPLLLSLEQERITSLIRDTYERTVLYVRRLLDKPAIRSQFNPPDFDSQARATAWAKYCHYFNGNAELPHNLAIWKPILNQAKPK